MKIKRVCVSLCILLSIFSSAFTQVIDYSHSTVESLHKEYIQKGRIPPFYAGPVLAGSINDAAYSIESEHTVDTNLSGAKFSLIAQPALQLFSDEVTIESPSKYSDDNAIDYTKNYVSMPPLFELSAEYYNSIGLGGGANLFFQPRFNNDYFISHNVNLKEAELNFLSKAYIYYDNPYIQLLIGRVHTQMGYPFADAIFFNNEIPYTDLVRMNIPFGSYFNLHWQITNIPSVQSSYQKDIKTGNDFKNAYIQDPTLDENQDYFYGFEGDDFPSIILNTYQRFGFQNDILKAGVSFNAFLARRNNRFEFADFFPFAEWHSTDITPNNMSLGIDFGIVPTENLLLDFQLGLDEVNAQMFGFDDTDVPTIWSARATMQNTLVMHNLDILFSTNVGYAHYLYGNFSGQTVKEDGETAIAKALYRYNGNTRMYMPYTSPYGPGSFWVHHQEIMRFTTKTFMDTISLRPSVLFLLKEVDTNIVSTEYSSQTEKAKNLAYFALELPISYDWRTLTASLAPSFHLTGLAEPTKTWFELRLSLRAEFSVSLFEKDKTLVTDFSY